jgi:uncharacterized protein YutE (UPF0331/DUF86 family)
LALIDIAERHAAMLDEMVPRDYMSYAADGRTRLATERALQVSVEAILDLAALYVAGLRLGLPPDEDGVVARLEKAEVLDESQARLLGDLRRFRNVLVHRYGTLDDRRVHTHALNTPNAIRQLTGAFRAALGK